MVNLKNQIRITIEETNLDLPEIENAEKDQVINKIKEVFVIDDPRAFWLSFKYKPTSIKYVGDYPHVELPKILSIEEDYYFLIDDFNSEFHLFKGNLYTIMQFIEECIGLDEYYLIDLNIKKMACETDHGELLYIDVHQNELKA